MNVRKMISGVVVAVATVGTLTIASPAEAGVCTPGYPIPQPPAPQASVEAASGPISCTVPPISQEWADTLRAKYEAAQQAKVARLEVENARLSQENASLRSEVAEVKAVNVDLRAIANSMEQDIKDLRAAMKRQMNSWREASLYWVANHLKPCKLEDSKNCVWWASVRGDRSGRNFVDLNGKTYRFGKAV